MSGQPLRVWIVPPDELGSVGDPCLRDLADRLRERGIRPELLDLGLGNDPDRVGETFRAPGLRRPWLRPLAIRWLAGFRGTDLPDLIHVQGAASAGLAIDLAETLRVPYLLELTDFLPRPARLRISQTACLGLIVQDLDLADDLTQSMAIAAERISVIPPGSPAADPESARDRRQAGHLPVIGATATPVNGSGLPELIDALPRVLASIGDVELLIAGSSGNLPGILELAQARGVADRITCAGDSVAPVLFWDALAIYCQAPSKPACGTRLAQAMARGIPVVASEVPGLRRWVEPGETGLKVPPGDPRQLADALIGLLNDRVEASRLAANAASAIAQRGGPDRQADALADLYRRSLADRSPRSWHA